MLSYALSAQSFLYPVKAGNKWGYIDGSGKMLINPQFENAGDFSDGLAPVKTGSVGVY